MGSKLSFLRRTAETEEKQSENLNNVSSSELTKPTLPSEPTPISADIEKVESKCRCVDCKCDPCDCTAKTAVKDISEPLQELKLGSVEPTPDKPQEDTPSPTQEPEVTATPTEISQPNESQLCQQFEDKVNISEDKSSEQREEEEAPKAEVQIESPQEVSPSESCQNENKAEEAPKDESHQKKCLCDPCTCNPCKCCGQESELTPNQDQRQERELAEGQAQVQGTDQELTREPENPNLAEEEKREESQNEENKSTEPKNEENVSEAREPINENVDVVPPEASLEVQTNE